jgi:hypothetical protein
MKKILIIAMLVSASYAVYNVGQTVSTIHQNEVLEGCASSWNNEPSNYYGQEFKLADWNGEVNG